MALCTITGFVYMPNGQPAADRLFKFKPSRKGIVAGYFGAIVPEVIEATTDELGFLTVQLLTGDYVAFSALYNGPVTVPDADEASLYEVFGGTGSVTPPAIAPNFTVLPSLLGSTSLGGTITVDLGSATGSPEPVITGTLTRPGASPVAVTQGQLITVQAGDQGGSLSLTATATNSAGVDTETVSRAIPAAIPAPVFTTPLADVVLTVGDADVVVNLDDYADNVTSYSVSPSGGAVAISGSIMTTSAAAPVDQLYVVTATGPGGTATDSFGVLVEAVDTSAQRVIVLTDYAGDCDDAAAMAIAARAHDQGDINLLGVVATSTVATSAPGVRGQLDAYGMQDIPVYAYQGSVGTYNDRYSIQMRDEFGVPGQTRTAYQDDVTGLRTLLAAAPNGSVKLIDVGAPVSTARLLASPADAISPLTGAELVAVKVIGLWAMAGNFPTGVSEYNMNRDVASSQAVYNSWPTPIYAHGGEVGGTIFTGPAPGTVYGDDPVKTAFDAFRNVYGGSLQSGKRQSWDPATVHHAIYGNQTLYSLSAAGTIAIDGTGVSTWTAGGGNRQYVTKVASDAAIAASMQALIDDYAVIAPPGPSNAVNRFFDLNEGTGSPTQRGGTLAMTRASGATWRTDPVGIAHSGTTSHMILPGDGLNADDLLIGAVIRLDKITGTQAIATLRVGTINQYQFRVNAATLECVVFTGGNNTTTIITSPSLLVVGGWAMATVRMGDRATTIRLNGSEVASASHPIRNKTAPDAIGVTVAGRYTGSVYTDWLDGDMIGFGYATNAALTDIAAFEAELRAMATAKGITLP